MTASLCAAALTAQFVSGKATRDALFLTSLGLTALPTMLMATSLCSILLVALHGRLSRRIPPATLVTTSFVLSGVLFLVRVAHPLHRPVGHCGHRLPPYLRVGPLACVRVLADGERALRSAHREEAVRPDRRRRDAGGPARGASVRTRRSRVGRAGHAPVPRRASSFSRLGWCGCSLTPAEAAATSAKIRRRRRSCPVALRPAR